MPKDFINTTQSCDSGGILAYVEMPISDGNLGDLYSRFYDSKLEATFP
jgi:hypothetical protein